MQYDITFTSASWHRNGVGGKGFWAILFREHIPTRAYEGGSRTMIASLFDEPGYCAVYEVYELVCRNIQFAKGNSWRGDVYEAQLRPALEKYLAEHGSNRLGPFAVPDSIATDCGDIYHEEGHSQG